MSADVPDFMLQPLALVHGASDEPADDQPAPAAGEFIPHEAPPRRERHPFTPGVFDGLDADLYHSCEAIGSGGIKKLLRSPGHYRVERDKPSQPSPAMIFGTAVHAGVLEPDTFATRVRKMPSLNLKRPRDREIAAEYYAEAAQAGAVVLSEPDYRRCLNTWHAIRKHPAAARLLRGAIVERSLFWEDARYKVPCKARWDVFNTEHGAIIGDIKTTRDASPEAFGRDAANLFYHAQAGHYTSGGQHLLPDLAIDAFVFIAAENEEPHAVACYRVDSAAMMAGMHHADLAYLRYQEAVATGEFGFYPDTIETLALPRWATRIG